MKKKLFLILLFLISLNQKVFAVTLYEALLKAYENNPELNAERENIKVSKEDLTISNSEFLTNYGLCLPSSLKLNKVDIEKICKILKSVI